jgi:hypothetical protein
MEDFSLNESKFGNLGNQISYNFYSKGKEGEEDE